MISNPFTSSSTRTCIVAEGEDWIVVNKPPFIETHPSKPNGRVTLWHELRHLLAFELATGGQVSIINRLDRETSGLTLVAKTHEAARRFHQLMERRQIEKEYVAIVWGWPEADRFTVNGPLLRQGSRLPSRIHVKQIVHPEGAAACTGFEVLARFKRSGTSDDRFSVLRVHPKTGRMHQIRVHLAHCGHPIVGDKLYGPDEGCYLEFIDTGWTPALATRLLLSRQALHSSRLEVPELGMAWQSPLEQDLADWIEGR